MDLTKDAIGNDGARTIQANHDTIIFSCGNGIGFVPLQQPGKFAFQHVKISSGQVSDIHICPFISERLVAVSTIDKVVRVYKIATVVDEQSSTPLHEFKASSGAANTPVLVCWNPQVAGILAIASGSKVDICSIDSGKIELTTDISSPAVSVDWAHDGSKVYVISKDSLLRKVDARAQNVIDESKVNGNKPVVKGLPDDQFLISSLSRMREREVNVFAGSKTIKTWSFGTASTPLLPIVDTIKKIVYLVDKSGSTLRWVETFSPFNEGACSTSVDQCSSGCLMHPLGLTLMEGEVNRLLIADTKGNVIPVKISIGRKSYLEFHEDIYTDVEVESAITAAEWLSGKDAMAKLGKISPSLAKAAMSNEPLSKFVSSSPRSVEQPKAASPVKSSPVAKSSSSQPVSTLSAREQRKWDKEEAAAKADKEPREIEPEVQSAPSEVKIEHEKVKQSQAVEEVGRGPPPAVVDDEDELEALRARKVTPALEQSQTKIESPQPVREVYKEDLNARRSEYGAPSTRSTTAERSIPNIDTSIAPSPQKENGEREVYREDLNARRSEYGAPSRINTRSTASPTSASALSAREQRKWDRDSSSASPAKEVYREDRSARRAEYGAKSGPSPVKPRERSPSPAKPARVSTAERELYKEDLSARRAEYGATPKLDGPTIASKEMMTALGKSEKEAPKEGEPYPDSPKAASPRRSPTKEELENAYALPDKVEPKQAVEEDKSPKLSDTPLDKSTFTKPSQSAAKEYTRKYLTGKMHHPRNSYTSLTSLNASLPNTARMIDATSTHILIPLAGPGGRLGVLPYNRPGRLPPLITALSGGATVADFELDRFTPGRCVSAHIDQAVRVWTIPANLEDRETDVEQPDHIFKGFDKVLGLSFHPYVKDLLMVTTVNKIHLLDVQKQIEISAFTTRGVTNTCWSLDGSKIALSMSDKTVKIINARDGAEMTSFTSAHSSTRPFRVAFVAPDKLITAGFGRGSTRQVALYNTTGQELQVLDMDISPSPYSLPYYDELTSVLYLIPRGTSNILPFHVTDTITALTPYSAADPVMGTAFLPPHLLATKEVEVARCLRLTTNEISVVGFYIPRPSGEFFHDDIYPEEVRDAYTAALTIDEWMRGDEPDKQKMHKMNPDNLKPSSTNQSIGRKSTPMKVTKKEEVKKVSELDEMFKKAKVQDGDEPDYQNNASNTRWD